MSWKVGLRIVDLREVGRQMYCKGCSYVLDINRTESESLVGFVSVLNIVCQCGKSNFVRTGALIQEGENQADAFSYDVNVRVEGMLADHEQESAVRKFLALLNIPATTTLKATSAEAASEVNRQGCPDLICQQVHSCSSTHQLGGMQESGKHMNKIIDFDKATGRGHKHAVQVEDVCMKGRKRASVMDPMQPVKRSCSQRVGKKDANSKIQRVKHQKKTEDATPKLELISSRSQKRTRSQQQFQKAHKVKQSSPDSPPLLTLKQKRTKSEVKINSRINCDSNSNMENARRDSHSSRTCARLKTSKSELKTKDTNSDSAFETLSRLKTTRADLKMKKTNSHAVLEAKEESLLQCGVCHKSCLSLRGLHVHQRTVHPSRSEVWVTKTSKEKRLEQKMERTLLRLRGLQPESISLPEKESQDMTEIKTEVCPDDPHTSWNEDSASGVHSVQSSSPVLFSDTHLQLAQQTCVHNEQQIDSMSFQQHPGEDFIQNNSVGFQLANPDIVQNSCVRHLNVSEDLIQNAQKNSVGTNDEFPDQHLVQNCSGNHPLASENLSQSTQKNNIGMSSERGSPDPIQNTDVSSQHCVSVLDTTSFQKIQDNQTLKAEGRHPSESKKTSRSVFKCSQCKAQFKFSQEYTTHMKTEHGVMNPHQCRRCLKSFPTHNQLKCHRKQHSPAEVHECTICLKIFPTGRRLRAHRTTHTHQERLQPLKRYRCEHCSEEFSKNYFLQIHLNYHKGNRPYECFLCEETFFTKPERRAHYKKCVAKKKSYLCELCGGRFGNASCLRKHRRVHTGERPHRCKFCDKTFSTSNTLKIHERQHTGEMPYVCDQCGSGFKQRVSLVTHLRSKHDINATLYSQPRNSPRYTHKDFLAGKPYLVKNKSGDKTARLGDLKNSSLLNKPDSNTKEIQVNQKTSLVDKIQADQHSISLVEEPDSNETEVQAKKTTLTVDKFGSDRIQNQAEDILPSVVDKNSSVDQLFSGTVYHNSTLLKESSNIGKQPSSDLKKEQYLSSAVPSVSSSTIYHSPPQLSSDTAYHHSPVKLKEFNIVEQPGLDLQKEQHPHTTAPSVMPAVTKGERGDIIMLANVATRLAPAFSTMQTPTLQSSVSVSACNIIQKQVFPAPLTILPSASYAHKPGLCRDMASSTTQTAVLPPSLSVSACSIIQTPVLPSPFSTLPSSSYVPVLRPSKNTTPYLKPTAVLLSSPQVRYLTPQHVSSQNTTKLGESSTEIAAVPTSLSRNVAVKGDLVESVSGTAENSRAKRKREGGSLLFMQAGQPVLLKHSKPTIVVIKPPQGNHSAAVYTRAGKLMFTVQDNTG